MSKIINRAEGPRGFNHVNSLGEVEPMMLMPGESREDLDLTDSHHPALAGMLRNGELEVEGQKGDELADAMKARADAARKAKLAAASAETAKAVKSAKAD